MKDAYAGNSQTGEKRKRGANFTDAHILTLLSLVSKRKSIIEVRKTNSKSWSLKAQAWSKITEEFSSATGFWRDTDSLRTKYDGMKSSLRRKCSKRAEYKHYMGVDPTLSDLGISKVEEKLLQIVGWRTKDRATSSHEDDSIRYDSIRVNNEVISTIGRGLTVLIGIHKDDTAEDLDYIVKKILNVRLFEDDEGKRWNKSVVDMQYEILCVSQFTLYYTFKGNKPDFRYSMKTEESRLFYENFLTRMRNCYKPELIKDGQFGAMMKVDICNDGPVTLEIESPRKVEPKIEK